MYNGEFQKERREKRAGKITEEIMSKISQIFWKNMNVYFHGAQWTSWRINSKRFTLRYITIFLSWAFKTRRYSWKQQEEICHVKLISHEKIWRPEAGREIYLGAEEKTWQPKIPHSAEISFRNGGEIKIFSDKQKLMEFLSSKAAQQEVLKAIV